MKTKEYLLIFIFIISCGKRDDFTIHELPNSNWKISFKGIDRKKSTISFPKDSTFTSLISQYWPLIISEGDLSFSKENFDFTNDDYSISGDWGNITKDSIWMIGHESLFPDTIYAGFNVNEGLLFMKISESQVINMERGDKIELFGGENIILELKD